MNITLAHHWLVAMRGGEKVLEELCQMFPGAPIETIVAAPRLPSGLMARHPIRQTLLGRLPGAHRYYRYCLPLYPLFLRIKRVDADLLLSSDASMIKGIGKTSRTRHICYCYSPPRYIWDLQQDYIDSLSKFSGFILKMTTNYLRAFDRRAAQRVDAFIAISDFVAQRIRSAYGRDSEVVYPPVDVKQFSPGRGWGQHYLVVSALTPYKRIDLAVRAFSRLGLPLVVIGDGPERRKLEGLAEGNVSFLGAQPDHVLRSHYQSCKALVFPGTEDFGITPLEAQASGRPVIAFGQGGALETVRESITGLFFHEQNEEALMQSVLKMERSVGEFDPRNCRDNALRFRPEVFRREMRNALFRACPDLFHKEKSLGLATLSRQ